MENWHQVTFSYADETLQNITATQPDKALTLTESLQILSSETGLQFTILNERFVTITKPSKGNDFKLQELQEIVVTNYLTSGISLNNNGQIVLKPEKFGILPGLTEPDVLQTIQALPGVMSVDETISNINIRGGTHDQNLILWDGIKMYQSGHFFGMISAFNPYLTKAVEVSKNGTSAQYGDGVSGVVDMQNNNQLSHQFKAGLGINLIHADGFAKMPLSKNTEVQLSLRRSVTDLFTTPTYDAYFKRVFQDTDLTNNEDTANNTVSKDEQFYFYDVSAKFLYDITEKDNLRLNFLLVNNDINYQEASSVNNVEAASDSNLNQQNLASGISYSHTWNDQLESGIQFYGLEYNLHATNYDLVNDQRLIQENKVLETALKAYTNYELNSNFKLSAGYQFTETGISNLEDVNNPVFKSYIKEVIRNHAGFTEVKFLNNMASTNIKLGARVNYIEKFDTFLLEPRFTFSQRFLSHFRFELLGEFKSQTTSQVIDLQNDFLGIEKRRWVLSNNASIPIIKSKQASAGLHFNKDNWLLSAEGYFKQVEGITTRSQGFQNQYQFVNDIGTYEVIGLDVLANKQIGNFSTWLSYSYSENNYLFEFINNGERFPNNVDVRHAVSFGATQTLNSLKLAVGVNWHTGKPYTEPDPNNPVNNNNVIYNDPNNARLPDYFRADLSATYQFKLGNTTAIAGASVWNVLDRENVVNTYYTAQDNRANKVESYSLGLTPNVSFRVNF